MLVWDGMVEVVDKTVEILLSTRFCSVCLNIRCTM